MSDRVDDHLGSLAAVFGIRDSERVDRQGTRIRSLAFAGWSASTTILRAF
jgi:hypothetical protein